MSKKTYILVYILVLLMNRCTGQNCYSSDIDQPFVKKSGDFLLVGVFNVGTLTEVIDPSTNTTVLKCMYETTLVARSYYALQRAISMVKVLEEFQLPKNYTLGYKLYTSCNSIIVSRMVSRAISHDESVVGVIVPGYMLHVAPIAGMITAYNIPTFTYIYASDELLEEDSYPTTMTLIDTEAHEAESMITYLKALGYKYIDIWYHKFSTEMAEYISNEYVSKVGCGRLTLYSYDKELMDKMSIAFNDTDVKPAKVQLLLFNNNGATKAFINHTINELKWNDTIFIVGFSNGRDKYIQPLLDLAAMSDDVQNTFIFFGFDMINMKLNNLLSNLSDVNNFQTYPEQLLSMYNTTKYGCTSGIANKTTSWLGPVITGSLILADSLNHTLQHNSSSDFNCIETLRWALFEHMNSETHYISFDGNELVANFINRSYSDGYELKAYQVKGNHTKLYSIGRASFTGLHLTDNTLPAALIAKPEQQLCQLDCTIGYYRSFQNVLKFPCCWECHACSLHFYTNKPNQNSCIECDMVETSNGTNTGCVPSERDYIKYNSSYFMIGATCSTVNILLIISAIMYFTKMSERPIIKAADLAFINLFLIGLLLGNLGVTASLIVPTPLACTLEILLFVKFFSLVTSSLALRSLKIYSIFDAANNFRRPRLSIILTQKGQICANLIILVINIIVTMLVVLVGDGWVYAEEQPDPHETIYLMCHTDTYITSIPFVIPTIFFLITLYLSFTMRNFPHNFRETTSIFVATMVGLVSAAMFLSGYHLSPPGIKAILRAMMLYIAVVAFLVCIFGPKVIILNRTRAQSVEDERNNITSSIKKFTHKDDYCQNVSTVTNSFRGTCRQVTPPSISANGSDCQIVIPNGNSEKEV